jgi:hypothetical protein
VKTVVPIVEGDGEVGALPVLLRRLGAWLSPEEIFTVAPPIRVKREQFLNKEEIFRKQLQLAALKCADDGWILILLDADDDCPAELAKIILERAALVVPHRKVSVVLPMHEYEAWFIAAALSLNGQRGFSLTAAPLPEAESIRGAKEWMSIRIPNGKYHEVADQPAFSARLDLQQAFDHSRSFRKLCKEWTKQMTPAKN